MGSRQLRSDIPINLPESFKDEARELRNKLLLYRFSSEVRRQARRELGDPKLNLGSIQILFHS